MEKPVVLIIEDDEFIQAQLARTVKKEGYTVLTASSGDEGLEVFEEKKPHIILSDMKMPGLSGLEVLHRVKRTSPQTQFILTTAYGELDNVIFALQQGAIDYIKKPIDLDTLLIALGRAEEQLEQQSQNKNPTILLVEDDSDARRALKRVIDKEPGWQVTDAVDGEQAMELFNSQKFDIILLDLNMPKKDGLTTLKEMREQTEDFATIVLTGYGDEDNAIQAMRAGAFNFIKKPIDIDQMFVSIDKAMEKLKLDRALKYRERELEIMKEVMAKFTEKNGLEVHLPEKVYEAKDEIYKDFMADLPLGILLLSTEFKVEFHNKFFDGIPEYFSSNEMSDWLQKKFEGKITLESLLKQLQEMMEDNYHQPSIIPLGENIKLMAAQVKIKEGQNSTDRLIITAYQK